MLKTKDDTSQDPQNYLSKYIEDGVILYHLKVVGLLRGTVNRGAVSLWGRVRNRWLPDKGKSDIQTEKVLQ